MEPDVLLIYLIVGIALIFIVLGLLVWAVVTILKGSKSKNASVAHGRQAAQELQSNATKTMAGELVAHLDSAPPLTFSDKDIELLKICRDVNSGNIYIEMEGKQYHKLSDIHDPKTGRLLLQTVADLNRFTRGVVPAVQTSLAAGTNRQQPHSASLLQPRASTEEPATPKPGSLAQRGAALIDNAHAEKVEPGAVPPQPSSLLQRVYNMSETVEEISKKQTPEPRMEEKPAPLRQAKTRPSGEPKVNLGSFWGRALTPVSTGSPVTGPRPLADELEDILVKLTDEMPDKPRHQIHFKTASDGRLVIEVDNTPYDDVNAIQDAEVKQTIRTVIGRWEKK